MNIADQRYSIRLFNEPAISQFDEDVIDRRRSDRGGVLVGNPAICNTERAAATGAFASKVSHSLLRNFA
jgi:hypothetical protein